MSHRCNAALLLAKMRDDFFSNKGLRNAADLEQAVVFFAMCRNHDGVGSLQTGGLRDVHASVVLPQYP